MAKHSNSLREFLQRFPLKEYAKGEEIITPGDRNENVYYLTKGHVASYALDEDGNEITLNIYKNGNIFPISEVLADRVNDFYFEALDDVLVRIMPSQVFLDYIKEDGELLYQLTKNLSIGLEGFMIRTLYLIRSDARKKVSSALFMMARRFGKKVADENSVIINLPQTHEDIARLAGVSRETASIELKKLQTDGIVVRKGKKTYVKDLTKLKEYSTIYLADQPLPYGF